VSTTKGTIPIRAKDPTPAEIARRAEKIRRGWSDDERQRRQVERVESLVYWPVAEDWLSADSWDQVAI
jgi:hypothetical protein